MIDVGRNNRPAARNFVADEFGGNLARDGRSPGVAGVLAVQAPRDKGVPVSAAIPISVAVGMELSPDIFPDRDEFHFRGDEALAGIMHLGNITARLGSERLSNMRETETVKFRVCGAGLPVLR